jgi:hypothetical protein
LFLGWYFWKTLLQCLVAIQLWQVRVQRWLDKKI